VKELAEDEWRLNDESGEGDPRVKPEDDEERVQRMTKEEPGDDEAGA
jgi:hypothetical protein